MESNYKKLLFEYINSPFQKREFSGDLDALIHALEKSPPEIIPYQIKNEISFRKYTYYLDKIINENLRNGKISPNIEKILVDVEDDISNGPEYEDIVLYRGIKDVILDLKVGDRITDKAFMSKTIDPDIAKGFSLEGTFLILHYPGRTRQIYLNDISVVEDEKEMLTFSGESFIVEVVLDFHRGEVFGTHIIYAVFDRYEEFELDIDRGIDIRFNEIENLFPEFVKIFKKDYILFHIKDSDSIRLTDVLPGFIMYDHELEFEPDYDNFPLAMVQKDIEEQLFNSMMVYYYSGLLLGVYHLEFEEYGLFEVTKMERDGLLTTREEDSFGTAYAILYDKVEKIEVGDRVLGEGELSLPKINLLWK